MVSAPTPAPDGSGPFFTVHVHAVDIAADGAHTPTGGPHLSIQATPAGLLRLLADVRKPTVAALLMFLHHGHVTVIERTVRVEVDGWGRDWLKSHGFAANAAQTAIAELRAKGWVRTEQQRRPGGYLGTQIGVLAGSVYGSGDVYLAPERKNPRPRTEEGKPLSDTVASPLDGKPVKGTTTPDRIDPLFTLDGETFTGLSTPDPRGNPTPEGKPIDGQPLPPTVVVSSPQYLQSLLRDHGKGTDYPARGLYAALLGTSSAITANPHHAVRLLTGLLRSYKADYRTPLIPLLGLPTSTDTAADLAAYLTSLLMDPDTAEATIPALARAADIHLRYRPDEFLMPRWFLAVATAAMSNVKSVPAFMHAAMYRESWTPAPAITDLLTTIAAAISPTPTISEPVLDPVDAAHLDQLLAVLADYFTAPDEQISIWRVNARLRGQAIARFTTENNGTTPEDVLRGAPLPTRLDPNLATELDEPGDASPDFAAPPRRTVDVQALVRAIATELPD